MTQGNKVPPQVEIQVTLSKVTESVLHSELSTVLGSKVIGVSTYGPDRPISILLDASATEDDKTQAATIAAAHKAPPVPPTQAQTQKASAANANGKQLSALNTTEKDALLRALLADKGWVNPDGTLNVV